MKTISRRTWLKSGLLSAGSMSLMSHISIGESFRHSVTTDHQGNIIHSPFFKEYLPSNVYERPVLKAKLNANENPYGPAPQAIEALKNAATTGNRYAWGSLSELTEKIAAKENVETKNIMMGPGSSDLLEKVGIVLFMKPGNVVSADPSYMSLIHVAESVGATWKPVPLASDWSHDLNAMTAAVDENTKLVYVCNPNNPTGSITDSGKLMEFCKTVSKKVPVFVDEAYLEFMEDGAKQSMVSLVAEGYDVIVARTFSKIHGMAGLRVGYMVAQPALIEKIQTITRGGMGITQTSLAAALASMDASDFLSMSRQKNAEVREYVTTAIKQMGYKPVPSSTSFLIFPIAMDGKEFLKNMYDKQVGVRAFEFMDKNWCRVSMGTMDEAKLFTEALASVLS